MLARGDLQKRNVKDFPLSNADFSTCATAQKTISMISLSSTRFVLLSLVLDGTPERIRAAAVSTNFFRMMGGSIIAGRDFQDLTERHSRSRQQHQPATLLPIMPPHPPAIVLLLLLLLQTPPHHLSFQT